MNDVTETITENWSDVVSAISDVGTSVTQPADWDLSSIFTDVYQTIWNETKRAIGDRLYYEIAGRYAEKPQVQRGTRILGEAFGKGIAVGGIQGVISQYGWLILIVLLGVILIRK